ncbi:MAG: DsrE family protein [Planctomycetaceae bacterium]|nr:DsrE family protein [Planctomycetaceae bacterium]
MSAEKNVVVMLTSGKSDNGKNATLAFSCALSSIALGQPTSVFLTSDGAVWGYHGSASGITVQGFPPLSDLIQQFLDAGGTLLLCSVCHRTCSSGGPDDDPHGRALGQTRIAGFATVVELALNGVCITF